MLALSVKPSTSVNRPWYVSHRAGLCMRLVEYGAGRARRWNVAEGIVRDTWVSCCDKRAIKIRQTRRCQGECELTKPPRINNAPRAPPHPDSLFCRGLNSIAGSAPRRRISEIPVCDVARRVRDGGSKQRRAGLGPGSNGFDTYYIILL